LLTERAIEFHAGWMARLIEVWGDYSTLGRQGDRVPGGSRFSLQA
jgi:hypothetical protein